MSRLVTTAVFPMLWFILICAGCGNSSTGNGSGEENASAITVTVQDDTGKRLSGFTVSTVPATRTVSVDSSGVAVIDGIAAGTYTVSVIHEGYIGVSRTVHLSASEHERTTVTFLRNLAITLKDDSGRLLSGASVSTIPLSHEASADAAGRVDFTNVPQDTVRFVVRRQDFPEAQVLTNVTGPSIQIIVPSGTPSVQIISPKMDDNFSIPRNIRLTGVGTDIEEGDLPDESLVWTSSLDGELGSGESLVVPFLSNGYHTITLRGYDSDGKVGETSVSVTVFDYQLDSYFPIPAGENWGYRYLVPEFYITNADNVSEYWVLKGLNVKVDNKSRRVIDIAWDTTAQLITSHFRLTLTDSLILDNGNLYVAQTTEQSREWAGAVESPYFTMYIATSYSPWYLFLKNTADITREPSYESTVRTETAYYYVYYNNKSPLYHESTNLTTSIRVGDEATIQTDKGLLKAYPMTIRQGDSEKKWYLTKGLGLIRIEDMALDISTVAVLTSASMYRFHSPIGKIAGSVPSVGSAPRFDLRLDRNNPDDLLKLHRLLTAMMPR